jgi:hypothetical protein
MEELETDGTITPAAELASEADGFNMFMPEDKVVHPDWTQMMASYDQEYERQVASVNDHMQRCYHLPTDSRDKDYSTDAGTWTVSYNIVQQACATQLTSQ